MRTASKRDARESITGADVRPAPAWERSPYFERAARFRARLAVLDAGGKTPDPQLVADAIVKAALDPATPLRTLVGPDAQAIASVRAQGEFEQFDAARRSVLDWWE